MIAVFLGLILLVSPVKLPYVIAADAAMFARGYESDYNLASQGIFMTTLFNLLTTPAIVLTVMRVFDM